MNAGASSSPAVELRGVRKRFGSRVILDGIDLAVAAGEVVALVGPSGSGKSTLLKMVSGIETPDSGRVFLGGVDCTERPPYRRAVHTVFQNYALFPHLDVAGNIGFPLAVAGRSARQRESLIAAALVWVRLEHLARRRVDTLSGGERQRVALARALVDSPQCVLLDEPLSALDPHLRAETLELLQGIQARLGTTFLLITHDREEALRLGQRIGVLHHGRLDQVATPEEIYRRPKTAFVASFLGRINWLLGEIGSEGGQPVVTLGGRRLPCPPNALLAPGRIRVGIRPEDIQIGTTGRTSARVLARQFLGDSVHFKLALPDGTTLLVDQRQPFGHVAAGDDVQIQWAPEAMHLFPPDAEEAGS